MHKPAGGRLNLIAVIGVLAASSAATAVEIETGVSAGLLFTDNARLTATNEEDDLIAVGYAVARVEHASGALRLDAEAGLTYQFYTNDTFDEQNFPELRLTGAYEQIRDRLDWNVQNYFTQSLLNPFLGTTPANIQNFNVFTFGPTISSRATGRQTITLRPQYRNYYFESRDNDNQQFELAATWLYRMYPTLAVNLDGSVTETVFEGSDNLADFTRVAAQAGIAGTTARSSYAVHLGVTRISRDETASTTEPSGSLAWSRNLTGYSTASLNISSDLTDSGNLLLSAITDPDNGGGSNIQVSNNVVRANSARLTYSRKDATVDTQVWGEVLEQNFLGDAVNRPEQTDRITGEIGASTDYRVTAVLSTGLSARYTRTRETDGDRTNKRFSVTGAIGYQLAANLRASLELSYEDQQNDLNLISDFTEFSAFVRIGYGIAGTEPAQSGGLLGRTIR